MGPLYDASGADAESTEPSSVLNVRLIGVTFQSSEDDIVYLVF